MPCSPARLASNRANSLRSTGPRTERGKERSRRNAVKHGLTGAGVALPAEEVAAVEGRFEALRDELAPRTVLGCLLVKRVAMLSVRIDRAGRQEAAALADRVEGAAVAFDEARLEEVQELLTLLNDDPVGAVRRMRRMPEGVDRLIVAWTKLGEDLGVADGTVRWTSMHCDFAERLDGRAAEAIGRSRIKALFRASFGMYDLIDEGDVDGLDDLAREAWAIDRLREIVEEKIADLRAHKPTLDLAPIARSRARAADRALLDTSKDAILARKYEMAADRAMYRALNELREVERAEAEANPDDDEPEPTPPEARERPVASFSPVESGMVPADALPPRGSPIAPLETAPKRRGGPRSA